MNNRAPLMISFAIVAAMLATSLWAWHVLPSGAAIPIHWDIHGKPNGFAKAPLGLFLAPAVTALITMLFVAIPVIEPRRPNLLSSAKFYHAVWIGVVLLMAVVHALALYSMMHAGAGVGGVIIPAVCLLMIVIGNYLGKTRSMFLGGIRTPWSLTSEYSWQRTHSLAGKLFMLAGMAGFVAVFMFTLSQAGEILVSALLAACVVSVVMSYIYWQRDPDRQTGDIAPG